jgi:hypothetical protein
MSNKTNSTQFRNIEFVPNLDTQQSATEQPPMSNLTSSSNNVPSHRQIASLSMTLKNSLPFTQSVHGSSDSFPNSPPPPHSVFSPSHPEAPHHEVRMHEDCPFSPTHPEATSFELSDQRNIEIEVRRMHSSNESRLESRLGSVFAT